MRASAPPAALLQTLEAIQRDHGALLRGGYSVEARPLLPSNAHDSGSAAACAAGAAGGRAGSREGSPLKPGLTAGAGAGTGGGGSGSPAEQLGPLAGFLRERTAELAAALEQRALADFHNWLSNVRAQARTIGLRAIRWAASERQQEEELTRQRKLLLPRLDGLQDVRAAGALVAQTLRGAVGREAPPVTPLQLPPPVAGSPAPAAGAAAGEASSASTPPASAGGSSGSPTAGSRAAAFKAARRAAGSSPTRMGSEAAAAGAAAGHAGGAARAAGAAGVAASPPGTAASSSRAAAAAVAEARTPVNPAQARMQQGRGLQRADTFQVTGALVCFGSAQATVSAAHVPCAVQAVSRQPLCARGEHGIFLHDCTRRTLADCPRRTTGLGPLARVRPHAGDLLEGVDMAPLHRCLHIHACLGRLPQFAEYYAENRRQQVR